MNISKFFSVFFLVIYAAVFINIIYNILQTKTGFGFPIWIQIVLGACFLVMTLSNFKQSHYVFGGVFASAVVLVAVSVVMTSIT
ncbi:hypothetical protein QJV45_08665 [Listeria booriae]|uniref:hypothetical protein n=1 Tax=Listeria booriae TaxID=1552123 RepID=UPI001629E0BC|nr:hypothetical protein [Listeria booriae]MBC2323967.1 hypothetical protein [Listeria booriae]MCD2207240.1 hypothetical protein [Listeria booriae]MDT0110534.1 hypothetical protein [Listeria booriae]